jgi:hypothetical protein
MKLKNFEIAEEYLSSVNVVQEAEYTLQSPLEYVPEHIREMFKDGKAKMTTQSWADHPEFVKLRHLLEAEGYVRVEWGWWNGDRVLKAFTLNGIRFYKDGQFPCASALGIQYKIAKENGRKTFSKY